MPVQASYRPTWAEINLENLKHNIKLLQSISRHSKFFCPMIKANAYGHGSVEVAKAAASVGVETFGVSLLEEALQLRESQISQELLIFGSFQKESCSAIEQNALTPVVHDFASLEALSKNIKAQTKVHIKLNTGMNRLGFVEEEIPKVIELLLKNKNLSVDGLCTHLLQGEDLGDEFLAPQKSVSYEQLQKFTNLSQKISQVFLGSKLRMHALNSSALVQNHFWTQDSRKIDEIEKFKIGSRPGIAIYGCDPSLHRQEKLDLRPVMSLKTRIVRFQNLKPYESVSYGGVFKANKEMKIAILPVGYADGISRLLSQKMQVLYRGQRLAQLGIICMDYLMIDVSPLKSVEIGDEVVLIGSQEQEKIKAEDLAQSIQSISYEIVSRISERVPRIYV